MVPQLAYLSEEDGSAVDDAERRAARRRTINLGTTPVGERPIQRIVLLDLSKTGLRLHCLTHLEIGECVVVCLPHAGEVEARIVWSNNDEYGARFVSPISAGAVSAAALASPARSSPAVGAEETLSYDRRPIPVTYVNLSLLALLVTVAGFLAAFALLPVAGFWAGP